MFLLIKFAHVIAHSIEIFLFKTLIIVELVDLSGAGEM